MATTFRISRPIARAVQTATGRVLRVVMVLSLWHAPIPWIHVHEFEGAQVERLESLSRHIAAFHAHELNRGSPSGDWHAHLVLPWCMNHHHDCPADDERDPAPDDILGGAKVTVGGLPVSQSYGQPTTRAFLTWAIPADGAAVAQYGPATSGAPSGPAPFRHFFETYGGSVAICDLVSVRLC
jgi:hypothetical protein